MEPQMVDGICKNCAAWTELPPPPGPVTIGQPKRGVCRMFPPTPVPLYDATGRPTQQMNIRPNPLESEPRGDAPPPARGRRARARRATEPGDSASTRAPTAARRVDGS